MTLSRRKVLIAGALGLVCVGGTWRGMRTPERALESWKLSRLAADDVRLFAFAHAILAPNPHNRQPWLIRMDGQHDALLLCDLDKRLPETDPFDRQTLIGFGAFIEITRIAAAEAGYDLKIHAFPEGEPGERLDNQPIARLTFIADVSISKDELYAQIRNRRSAKVVFDHKRQVSADDLIRIAVSMAQWTNDANLTAPLGRILADAIAIEMRTPRTHSELVQLMRIGSNEIEQNPDGIALRGPPIEAALVAGLLDRDALADPNSIPFKQGLEA